MTDGADSTITNGGDPAAPARVPPRAPPRAWVMPFLIGANVAVFAAMLVSGVSMMTPRTSDLLSWGANSGARIGDGQWWRLMTAAFLHVGAIHLFVNMLALRSLGIVERLFGSRGFLFIYLAGAWGASVTSVLWNPSRVSAGASGAIFALFGALLAFLLMHRHFIPPATFRPMIRSVLFTIGINVVFGLSVQFVDNAAHLGGLATGFVAGMCLNRELAVADPRSPTTFVAVRSRKPLVRAIVFGLLLLMAAALIPVRLRHGPGEGTDVWIQDAQRAIAEDDFAGAEATIGRVLAADPNHARAHYLLAICCDHRRDAECRKREVDRAIELDDSMPEAHLLRAQIRRIDGDLEGELADLDRLVERLVDNPAVYRLRAHARYAAGRWKDARRDFQMMDELEHEGSGEAQIYLWLVDARLGQRDKATEELKKFMGGFQAGNTEKDWRAIGLVLIGETERATLDALASGSDRDAETACRARFVAASLDLIDGGPPRGVVDGFKRCLSECGPNSEEYWSARAELARLKK